MSLLIVLAILSSLSPFTAQSQSDPARPYGFDGNRLGMSLAEFKTAHMPGVLCTQVEAGIVSCGYDTGYVDESDPERRIDLKVTGLFIDANLAGLWITLFEGTGSCFEPAPGSLGPAQKYLWMTLCRPYMRLFQMFTGITDTLGSAKAIQSKVFSQLYAIRWENEMSVGEFQPHECIKTVQQGAWFSEVLEGRYCGDGKPSGTVAMMAYLDKKLIRIAITRLSEVSAAQEAPFTNCDAYAAIDVGPGQNRSGVAFDKIDPKIAVPACEEAVRRYPGSTRLIFELGRSYSKSGNFAAALGQFQKAAEAGYPPALNALGVMYADGSGVPKDEREAVNWYRKAAGLGDVGGQLNLGFMYENGRGIPRDYSSAFEWYQKAADQGSAQAEDSIGYFYARGMGVKKDSTKAVAWFRKAAEQGMAGAQYNLGTMYEHGDGVTMDRSQALAWYTKAAEQGNDPAMKEITEPAAIKQNVEAVTPQGIPKQLWGRWTIDREVPASTIACWGDKEARGIIGTEIEYGPEIFRWKDTVTKHPNVQAAVVSAEQFHGENSGHGANSSQATFRQLGIKDAETTEITIKHPDANITGSTTEIPGDVVLIKDQNTVVFSVCNVYFEAKRNVSPGEP